MPQNSQSGQYCLFKIKGHLRYRNSLHAKSIRIRKCYSILFYHLKKLLYQLYHTILQHSQHSNFYFPILLIKIIYPPTPQFYFPILFNNHKLTETTITTFPPLLHYTHLTPPPAVATYNLPSTPPKKKKTPRPSTPPSLTINTTKKKKKKQLTAANSWQTQTQCNSGFRLFLLEDCLHGSWV